MRDTGPSKSSAELNLTEYKIERGSVTIEVLPSRNGMGVFATHTIIPGDEILRLSGPLLTFAETLQKGDKMGNPLQVGPDAYLDLEEPGVYVNHSCNPNAGIVADSVLVALQPIFAGEEINFDYSTTMDENYWTMECNCCSSCCRGLVTDFRELPEEAREYYLGLGVVQRFIADAY